MKYNFHEHAVDILRRVTVAVCLFAEHMRMLTLYKFPEALKANATFVRIASEDTAKAFANLAVNISFSLLQMRVTPSSWPDRD
jgi:hypothetical protein